MWVGLLFILIPLTVRAQAKALPHYLYTPTHTFPTEVTLCGEKVPLDIPEIWEALDREFTIAVYNQGQVMLWLKRAGRHFPHIEERLKAHGLPDDLKYLAVAESDLQIHAFSHAGAGGPWQFIRPTATRFGLRQGGFFDDRLCYDRATEAALTYLKELYDRFGTWSLAMAAYNCGEGRVAKEMEEQGESSYFRLKLPLETERYVFRIMAIKIILDNPEKYGFVLEDDLRYKPLKVETLEVKFPSSLHMRTVASACGTYLKRLKELNPEIQGYYFPAGTYTIRLPQGSTPHFQRFYAEWATKAREVKETRREVHVVQKGETLNRIASKYGVDVASLKKWNGLKNDTIRPGQELRIF